MISGDEDVDAGAGVSDSLMSLPLVVDLDGTLIKSDSLVDALMKAVFKKPQALVPIARSLIRGRGALKAALSGHGLYQSDSAPIQEDFLTFLREQKAAGRELHLATAADRSVAEVMARRVGLFSSIEASQPGLNLKGRRKLARLKERFPNGFSYAGNDCSDIHVLAGGALHCHGQRQQAHAKGSA